PRRVDVGERAAEQRDTNVDDGVAGERPLDHRLADALLDRRDEVARDHPADDLVDELEAGASRQRLDLEVGIGELTVAAGLLLEPALRLCPALDGLLVVYRGRLEQHLA